MFYQDTTDNMVLMICLNPVADHDNSIKRGLFATDTDLLSKLKDKTFKEILLTDATTEDGEVTVVKYLGFRNNGTNYWISGTKKTKKSEVTSDIMNYYFLSNHQVRWTMYGLASLRVCIAM